MVCILFFRSKSQKIATWNEVWISSFTRFGDVAWPPGAESTIDPDDPTLNTIQGISIPRIREANASPPRTLESALLKGWRVSEQRVAKMSVAALLSALPSDRHFCATENKVKRFRRILAAEAERLFGLKPESTNRFSAKDAELAEKETRRLALIARSVSSGMARFIVSATSSILDPAIVPI